MTFENLWVNYVAWQTADIKHVYYSFIKRLFLFRQKQSQLEWFATVGNKFRKPGCSSDSSRLIWSMCTRCALLRVARKGYTGWQEEISCATCRCVCITVDKEKVVSSVRFADIIEQLIIYFSSHFARQHTQFTRLCSRRKGNSDQLLAIKEIQWN